MRADLGAAERQGADFGELTEGRARRRVITVR